MNIKLFDSLLKHQINKLQKIKTVISLESLNRKEVKATDCSTIKFSIDKRLEVKPIIGIEKHNLYNLYKNIEK